MTTISAVSYLNAAPLVYGIRQRLLSDEIILSLDIPARCAQKLLAGEAQVALTPVAAIPQGNDYKVVTDFCIGATAAVATVCLFANSPVESLHTIYLDGHSRTSVRLVQLLARDFWRIKPNFKQITEYDEVESLKSGVGCVLIGDKTFGLAQKFTHVYDLAEAWIAHTGLPFVFAAWVARADVSDETVERLNHALQFGVQQVDRVIAEQRPKYPGVDVARYLTHNISYPLDGSKREGLQLFLSRNQAMGEA